jgi:2-hydroxy-6-oxonona-2,4-dienedioate hydrolase
VSKTIYCELLGSQTRFYQTRNYRTRVIEVENGRVPLIFLHGGGGHAEAFARNIVALSDVSRPMAMDFIWHGLSSKPSFWDGKVGSENFWLRQFTDQVLELMDLNKIQTAVIEGQSLGGWVAIDLALRFPQRVRGLILNTAWGITFESGKVVDSKSDMDALLKSSLDGLNNPTPEAIRRRMEWLMPVGGITDEIVELRRQIWTSTGAREALTAYYQHLFQASTEDAHHKEKDIVRIKVPTLTIWTDRNPLQGPDAGRRIKELLPNSELEIIENAGHWVQWEKPAEHNAAVMKFLASLR